jgi:hypothetical protein
MISSPARPTLTELWDERAVVNIHGPACTDAELRVTLHDNARKQFVEVRRSVRIPVDDRTWNNTAHGIRTDPKFSSFYDDAESCTVTVARDGVGLATLNCERGFQPLRWRLARAHGGRAVATLVDRTDGGTTTVDLYVVEEPLKALPQVADTPFGVPSRGGLAIAHAGDATAAVILPTNPNQVLHLPPVRHHITSSTRSTKEVLRLVEGHARWLDADLPADAFAAYEQRNVGDAIARAIGALIGGGHWASLERTLAESDEAADHLEAMQQAVGVSKDHQALASSVAYSLYRWLAPENLLLGFDEVVKPYLTRSGITGKPAAARFLLMLAGRPGYIADWPPGEAAFLIDRLLESPILYRAARFAVLGTRAINDAEGVDRGF